MWCYYIFVIKLSCGNLGWVENVSLMLLFILVKILSLNQKCFEYTGTENANDNLLCTVYIMLQGFACNILGILIPCAMIIEIINFVLTVMAVHLSLSTFTRILTCTRCDNIIIRWDSSSLSLIPFKIKIVIQILKKFKKIKYFFELRLQLHMHLLITNFCLRRSHRGCASYMG